MWDTKYRPKHWHELLGQAGTVKILRSRLAKGEALDTSYLLSGPAGTGKTTTARIFARSILCPYRDPNTQEPCDRCDSCLQLLDDAHPGFAEKDAASKGTIEHVRALLDDIPFVLPGVEKRIVLFDECHRLSKEAQDALLKSIEEKKLVCFFCTTEPAKVQGPIRSRCEPHAIRKPTYEEILGRAEYVLKAEGVAYEVEAVKAVIQISQGHVRDVLNRLETLSQVGAITLDSVRENLGFGLVSSYFDLLLAAGDPQGAGLSTLYRLAEQVSPDTIAQGMSECALACFRQTLSLTAADLAYDPVKGKELLTKYGPAVVNLAHLFSSRRYDTLSALAVDYLTLGSLPALPTAVTATAVVPVKTPVAPVPGKESPPDAHLSELERQMMAGFTPPKRASVAARNVPPGRGVEEVVGYDDNAPLDGSGWRDLFTKILPPRGKSHG